MPIFSKSRRKRRRAGRRAGRRDTPSTDKALGPVFVKPSEKAAVKDSGVKVVVPSGPSPKTSGGGGGSGSRAVQPQIKKAVQPKVIQKIPLKQKIISKREILKRLPRKRISREVSRILEKQRRKTEIIKKAADIVSGGSLTERRLRKEQTSINKEVEDFNKQFGNGDLSEEEFKKANKKLSSIKQKQKDLEIEEKKLKESTKHKVKEFLTNKDIKLSNKQIANLKKSTKKFEKQIEERKKKGKSTKRLEQFIKANKKTLDKGSIKLIATTVPMGPAAISGVSGAFAKADKIKFVGKQITRGNKIITDIVFVQNNKRIGFAKGVTIIKGKKGFTIAAGRSGVPGLKFPSGKPTIKRLRSFISKETGITKQTKFKLKTKVDLLRKSKKAGTIEIIKDNLEGLSQIGVGRVATVRGKKFIRTIIKFPSGKLSKKPVKRVNKDTFASISAIFTKGDLSKIIGKTINVKGRKSEFIGIIRGERGVSGLSGLSSGQKLQYQEALNKVIGAAANSLKKVSKFKGISKSKQLALVSEIIVKAKITPKKITPKIMMEKLKIAKPKHKIATTKNIAVAKNIVRSKINSIQKSILSAKSLVKGRVKLQVKQKVNQQIKQAQKEVQKLKQVQKQIQKLKSKTITKQQLKTLGVTKVGIPTIPRIPRIQRIIIPKRKKKKIIKTVIKKKKEQAYGVKARPVKKRKSQKKPKLVKVNKVPLKESRAKDIRNFITDTSLSASAKIVKVKGKPRKTKLKVPKGYAKKTNFKFRKHKIVKGKKVKLTKGKVIEKRNRRLDTKQEKQKIGLRRRIKQISKPVKKKKTKRRSKR